MKPFSSLLFLSLSLIIALVSAVPFHYGMHHACNPAGRAFHRYSGYRIQRQFRYTVKTNTADHKMIITQCSMGEVIAEREVSINDAAADLAWNTTVCAEALTLTRGPGGDDKFQHPCLRMARRAPFIARDLTLYMPETIVGAMFSCNEEGSACDALLPLLADHPTSQWTQFSKMKTGQIVYRIPLLYTPDVLDRKYIRNKSIWARRIDPAESYPDYRPKIEKSIREFILGSKGADAGVLSRFLDAYSPLRVIRVLRYVQALIDQW